MSASSYQYRLLGFSPELDWRPLCLVSPMPPARICSVCGLVPQTTCYLLCVHLLCERCYQRCRVDGAVVCPLDSDVCTDDDVLWRSFPVESLTRIQVKCWNEANGCNVTAAASDITRHFQEECEFHVINCPKCSVEIRSGDLYTHLRSCNSLTEPSTARVHFDHDVDERKSLEASSEGTGRALHDITAQDNSSIASSKSQEKAMKGELGRVLGEYAQDAAALKASMEERTNEMRRELEALSSSHNDRLSKLEQNVTALKDILDTERNHTKEQIKRDQEVAAEFKKKSEGHAAEFGALNKNLEVLNAKVDELCVRTDLHAGVVERFSNHLNAVEDAMKKQIDETASRDCVGGSPGSAAVAGRDILAEENGAGDSKTLKSCSETQPSAVQASAEELLAQNKLITERLNNLSSSVDLLQAWKDSADKSASENRSKVGCSVFATENAPAEGALSSILTIVRNFGINIRSHSWVLKGLKALKKKATKAGEACHMSEKVYLRGYCVSPGVVIKAQRGSFWLHFCLQVHKGVMDDDLRWPFDNEAMFSIIHPTYQRHEIHIDHPNSASLTESGDKPVMNFDTSSFCLSFLEKKEYIEDDQLILKLELLASR